MHLRRADLNGWRYATRTAAREFVLPRARDDGSLGLVGGEALRLGAEGPCRARNEYADLALLDAEGEGMPLARMDFAEGDILCAYFPASGLVIPGRAGRTTRGYEMEPATRCPGGERAFILTEPMNALVTASLPSSGDRIPILPRLGLTSWLMACGSRAAEDAREYDVDHGGEFFVIRRRGGSPILRGRFKGGDNEHEDVSWRIATLGLGGLIGDYDLEREEE